MPYIGYFSLIHAVDEFHTSGTWQYTRLSWMNRNRLAKMNEQEHFYFRFPHKKYPLGTRVQEIECRPGNEWKNRILAQVKSRYKVTSPFQKEAFHLVQEILAYEDRQLDNFVTHSLRLTAQFLGVTTPIFLSNDFDFKRRENEQVGDLLIRYLEGLDGEIEFINPIGGMKLYSPESFQEKGMELSFLRHDCLDDPDNGTRFSVLHLLLTRPLDEVQAFLEAYQLLNPNPSRNP